MQEFLRSSNLSANFQKLYERELKRFLGWAQCRWSDLTLRHLGQYKAYLMELEVGEGKRLSKSSINSALTALKRFFKWLTQFHPELCPTNPTKGVKFEKAPLPPAQNLSPEEMARVWNAIAQRGNTQLRDLALVQLLSHNLRAGEMVAANIGSFDGRLVSITETKNSQPRLVPLLSAEGQQILQDYLDWRQKQGKVLTSESLMLLSHHQGWEGERLSYHGIYFAVEAIGQLAGLPDLHPHQFRHASATEYLRMGLDPAHARRLTGYENERSFRRYTVATEQEAAIAAFYKAEVGEQPLVFAKTLDRKQRQLLEEMAKLTGRPPLYQADLDESAINFAHLWQENLDALERMVADVRALPERVRVAISESINLADLLGDELFSFSYLYDFEDMWQHEIKVEKRVASKSGQDYPTCLAGKLACLPEDCGGDWEYAHLLKVLKNPRHPEHRERKEWVGSEFGPKVFDLKQVNQDLRELEVEAAGYGN